MQGLRLPLPYIWHIHNMTRKCATTYRVQGLPARCTSEDARKLIEDALNTAGRDCFSIRVHSLAKSASNNDEMTATVSSSDLGSVLTDATHPPCWKFEIPKQFAAAGAANEEPAFINVDTLFDGFTPFNSFNNATEHLFEYGGSTSLHSLH